MEEEDLQMGLQGGGVSLFEVVVVHWNVFGPFHRHCIFGKYSCYRADRLAGCAVDALVRVNVEHIISIGGIDTIYRTNIDAGAIFDPNTRFCDYVGHIYILPIGLNMVSL